MGSCFEVTVDLTALTVAAGAELIRAGRSPQHLWGGFGCQGRILPGPHWAGEWVATRGCGNQGFVVLRPRTPAARVAAREATVSRWESAGLTRPQAEALYGARLSYRHELIASIVAVLSSNIATEAMLEFPGVGPGSHLPWMRRWENRTIALGQALEGLSWGRIAALAAAVRVCAAA